MVLLLHSGSVSALRTGAMQLAFDLTVSKGERMIVKIGRYGHADEIAHTVFGLKNLLIAIEYLV